MLKLKYNLLLIFLIIFSLFMVLNSNSLYFMWIFMELNVLVFLTFLIMNSEFISIESMKYYLMSSFSSIIFMFFLNLNLYNFNLLFILVLMNVMMLMKLGVIPFHFWFIDMMMNLNWLMCFFLSTIQKVIPFIILSFLYVKNFLFLISLLGGILGLMMSFNHILLKKIMSYSSINHMFWMLMSLLIKFNLWIIYFFNYMMINMILFYLFNFFKIIQISDLYLLFLNKKLNYMYYMIILMLSLGGLPPFYGFLLKWYMIINMMNWMMNLMMIFLIIYSLIFLYYYFRLLYNMMLLNFFSLMFNMFELNFLKKLNFKFIFLMNLIFTLNLFMFFFWILF